MGIWISGNKDMFGGSRNWGDKNMASQRIKANNYVISYDDLGILRIKARSNGDFFLCRNWGDKAKGLSKK
jgi:hypothetical protein